MMKSLFIQNDKCSRNLNQQHVKKERKTQDLNQLIGETRKKNQGHHQNILEGRKPQDPGLTIDTVKNIEAADIALDDQKDPYHHQLEEF